MITIRDKALATFAIDFLRAAMAVGRHRIDTVIDMEFFSRASAIFTFLSGAATGSASIASPASCHIEAT